MVRTVDAALAGLAAAVLGVGLSGCAAGSAASSASVPAIADAPLETFMDGVYGLGALSDAERAREEQQWGAVQAAVATCMVGQGFDYTPAAYVPADARADAAASWDTEAPDLVAQYGYGFVASPSEPGAAAGETPTADPGEDPNAAYRSALTPSAQAAYDDALYSGIGVEDGATSTGQGCLASARSSVVGAQQDIRDVTRFQPLFAAVDAFYRDRLQWTGMAVLEGEWASCMAGSGYAGFHQETDAPSEIGTALAALRQAAADAGTAVSSDDLTALGAKERTLAVADLRCRQSVDYASRLSTLWYAAERQFMSDHDADIRAARAWLDQEG